MYTSTNRPGYELERNLEVSAFNLHLCDDVFRRRQPRNQNLVHITAHFKVALRSTHHNQRIETLRVGVIGAQGRNMLPTEELMDITTPSTCALTEYFTNNAFAAK